LQPLSGSGGFSNPRLENCRRIVKSGASLYVSHSSTWQREVQNAMEVGGFEVRCQVIWAKNTFLGASAATHFNMNHFALLAFGGLFGSLRCHFDFSYVGGANRRHDLHRSAAEEMQVMAAMSSGAANLGKKPGNKKDAGENHG
jgi:hypothetical protein